MSRQTPIETNHMAATIDAATLAARTGGSWHDGARSKDVTITNIEIDSRKCRNGTLFLALPGSSADGHDFITAAATKGAAAALVSRPNDAISLPQMVVPDVQHALTALGSAGRDLHRQAGGKLVAITGSVGKTGSKEMLAHGLNRILAKTGGCHASRASFNNHMGVPMTLAMLPDSTMPAVQELGMNATGEIAALTTLARPDIAIITRIADSHAGRFNSLDDIAAAKAEIFNGLAEGGTAIINRDDAYFEFLADRASRAGAGHIITFGTADDADAQLISATDSDDGTAVKASLFGRPVSFQLGMRGFHWAMNAMAVLAAADTLDIDAVEMGQKLHDFNNLLGRGAVCSGLFNGHNITLIDDSYNAGPASMKAAFGSLSNRPADVMVLSDMLELGDGTDAAHTALGPAIIALRPRILITIGSAMARMASVLPAGITHREASSPEDATALLASMIRDGDTVFIKGSNGSGAWRVAADLLSSFESSQPAAAGEANHAA